MTDAPAYQVLARKYRPQVFADLIGQEAMVRVLRNAFAAGRIAHAFVLTGVRGVGKTTTARIIARGLNCIGPDGQGGVTVDPCGVCGPCRAIAEGRHTDVLEMDAATHTQVDRMRELLASVPYRPAETRYKVYIIDEVHMLSTSSFNALLKTLEEPPAHVKFLFATTEIRKVPVTVLSRCQRFDLRRIEPDRMIGFLRGIAAAEGVAVADGALALIARAAEGSARDALSLLDQAIAHGGGATEAQAVRDMLGLADRGRVLDLFGAVMRGDAAGALAELGAQYGAGADPMAVLRDLAEVTHWISVVKITPEAVDDPTVTPDERARGRGFAETLPLRVLARLWQMLLKALEEVAAAPNAMMAAEMALIRMTHVADLPTPEELVRRLTGAPAAAPPAPAPPAPASSPPAPRGPVMALAASGGVRAVAVPAPDALASFARFDDVVALIRARGDVKLLVDVETHLSLVGYAPGRIEFAPDGDAPRDLAPLLKQRLEGWTGARWGVSVVAEGGAPTLRAQRTTAECDLRVEAEGHPLVRAALAAFPRARIIAVRPAQALALESPPSADYLSPVVEDIPDDWDPFEEEG